MPEPFEIPYFPEPDHTIVEIEALHAEVFRGAPLRNGHMIRFPLECGMYFRTHDKWLHLPNNGDPARVTEITT